MKNNKIFLLWACFLTSLDAIGFDNAGLYQGLISRGASNETKLFPKDGNNQRFGNSVSVSGNTMLIGTLRDSENGFSAGAAYIYRFENGTWEFKQKLIGSNTDENDQFGFSVSLDGNRAVIGANAKQIDGVSFAGAAYVFEYIEEQWVETKFLQLIPSVSTAQLGYSVSIQGDNILLGAPTAGPGSVHLFSYDKENSDWFLSNTLSANDGQFADNFGESVSLSNGRALIGASNNANGAAYLFDSVLSDDQIKLEGDGASVDEFGFSVSLEGDRAVVGARHETVTENKEGTVYIFEYDGLNDQWFQADRLVQNNPSGSDEFGYAVSLVGDSILAGAPGDDENGTNTGAVYLYEFDGTDWLLANTFTGSDISVGSDYGKTVSLSKTFTLIGAPLNTGNGSNSGAVYSYLEDKIFADSFDE